MGTMIASEIMFKIRRTAEGTLRATVRTTPAFEAALKAIATGRTHAINDAQGMTYKTWCAFDFRPIHNVGVEWDQQLLRWFCILGSGESEKVIEIPREVARTKEQIQKVCSQLNAWVEAFALDYFRACEFEARYILKHAEVA